MAPLQLFGVYTIKRRKVGKSGKVVYSRRSFTIPTRALLAISDLCLGPLKKTGRARWTATAGSRRTYYQVTIDKLLKDGRAEMDGDFVYEPTGGRGWSKK